MSYQPHRVISGKSNSGHKQTHFQTLLTYVSTLCQVNLQNQSLHKHITYIYAQPSDTHFQRVSPLYITPVKRAHKARTVSVMALSISFNPVPIVHAVFKMDELHPPANQCPPVDTQTSSFYRKIRLNFHLTDQVM